MMRPRFTVGSWSGAAWHPPPPPPLRWLPCRPRKSIAWRGDAQPTPPATSEARLHPCHDGKKTHSPDEPPPFPVHPVDAAFSVWAVWPFRCRFLGKLAISPEFMVGCPTVKSRLMKKPTAVSTPQRRGRHLHRAVGGRRR